MSFEKRLTESTSDESGLATKTDFETENEARAKSKPELVARNTFLHPALS
jgi:hypothetical protein